MVYMASFPEKCGTGLERALNNYELFSSHLSAFPVVGTIFGVIKVALGAVQTISALAIGLLIGLPVRARSGNTSILSHSWTHVKHGIGNFVGGTLEAIPGVGTVLFLVRLKAQQKAEQSKSPFHIRTQHEGKFMPYAGLEADDADIPSLVHCDQGLKNVWNGVYRTTRERFKAAEGFARQHRWSVKK